MNFKICFLSWLKQVKDEQEMEGCAALINGYSRQYIMFIHIYIYIYIYKYIYIFSNHRINKALM